MVTVVVAGPSAGFIPLREGFAGVCVVSEGGAGGAGEPESFFEHEKNKRLVDTKKVKTCVHENFFMGRIFGQNTKEIWYRITIDVPIFPDF